MIKDEAKVLSHQTDVLLDVNLKAFISSTLRLSFHCSDECSPEIALLNPSFSRYFFVGT